MIVLALLIALTSPLHAKNIVNDVTQLNPIEVDSIATPVSTEEVQSLIRQHSGPVSIGGGHFSMGGQTASENTLHLDMRKMDGVVAFNPDAQTITVQAGITWRKIQEKIDSENLSVKIMQSYANFTVGGSLSVNCHGRYVGEGPLIGSVRSFKIVLADGSLVEASPQKNTEIFYGAIGGYGGLGVIVEATLALDPNERMLRRTKTMAVTDYRTYFDREVRGNDKLILQNADIYPPDYKKLISITFERTHKPLTVTDRLMPPANPNWLQNVQLYAISELPFGRDLRARVIDPLRLRGEPVMMRNYEAGYDVKSLEPTSRVSSTYVLQEYFIPVERFDAFVPKMTAIFQKHGANILNVSVRHSERDPGTLLAWAKVESFAFVIYYKQGTSQSARDEVAAWTRELIDASLSLGGTYYLPYQIWATDRQFLQAYPRAVEFFTLKKKLDPENKFRNKLWDRYYRPPIKRAAARPEENTFLTLPEWYVVYSADAFAAHLNKGKRPSDFPYFKSIGQFWGLYRAMWAATSKKYPFNFGTHLMIGVVGASFTAEYLGRGLYEASIGSLSERFADFSLGPPTTEDKYLADTADAYAKFIHETPWYKFPFGARLKEFFTLKSQNGGFRATERRLEGIAELSVKSAWAWVIGVATGAAYEPEQLYVDVLAKKPARTIARVDDRIAVLDAGDPKFTVLHIPRYEAFTEIMGKVLKEDLELVNVGGNTNIVLSVIAAKSWNLHAIGARELYSMDMMGVENAKRVIIAAEIPRLTQLSAMFTAQNVRLEHLYDY